MTKDGQRSETWQAGRWERANAESFRTWRASEESLAQRQLETLCQAIDKFVRMRVAESNMADAIGRAFDVTRRCCDKLKFETDEVALAYLMQHLANRYDRVTRVLERLFVAGHLPIRRTRLTVLDIGAGPAPGLYAIRDFYDDLHAWAQHTNQGVDFVSLTDPHALDNGLAWDAVLHHLSETIHVVRRPRRDSESRCPFRRTHADLTNFSVREVHIASREAAIEAVMRDFDAAEGISRSGAQMIATDESKRLWAPSAYDIIVICNFLTNPEITDQFAQELQELGDSLTPGGVLVALGGTGGQYLEVWPRLDSLLRVNKLVKLDALSTQMDTNDNSGRRTLIRGQIFDTMTHVRNLCTAEARQGIEDGTTWLPREQFATRNFPLFQVQCWKNQAPAW